MLSSPERPEQTARRALGASKLEEMRLRLRFAAVPALALVAGGCLEITKSVTGEPPPVASSRIVSIRIEYRQPNGCANLPEHCNDLVVFFGSWMGTAAAGDLAPAGSSGGPVRLSRTPGTYVWTGTVTNVPVNFPPREQPYLVRVFDPHIVQSETGGVTALRLVVGGQTIMFFDQPGTASESGVIFIDDNGIGRNPY
jgi:hypothetical protein